MADLQQNNDAPDEPVGPLAYASPDTDAKVNEIRREVRQQEFAPFRKIIWIAPAILSCVIIAWVALEIRRPGRRPSLTSACLSNLRQIGMALQQYASTNSGIYPPRLADLCTPTFSSKFFVCPASKTEVIAARGTTPQQCVANLFAGTNHVTYVYVAGGAKAKSLKTSAVLAYEPVPNHSTAPHSYGTVLFADGHAVLVPAATLTTMIQQLNSGQNPPPATSGF